MMSDSEPDPPKPDSVEEPPEGTDSLSMFPSEGTEAQSAPGWPSETDAGIRKPRYRSGQSVPVAIADDRATRETIRKLEAYVQTVSTLQEICTSIDTRLAQAEATLARTEGVLADRTLHELSTRMADRLAQTEDAIRHIERVVTSGPPDELFAIQTLCANIEKRLAHVEETLGRTDEHISARLTGTENAVRRIEGLVASGALESKSAAPSSPAVAVRGLPAAERLVGLGAATVVLVGALIFVVPARIPISVAAPPPQPAEQQTTAPILEQAPHEQAPPEEPTAPTRLAPAVPDVSASAPAPRRRIPGRTTADAAVPVAPVRFVGDLSITSTPAGATVFVNGRAAGVTPVVLREQRAGSVAVQIASDGFERWSASVQIPAGQLTRVVATLRPNRPQ